MKVSIQSHLGSPSEGTVEVSTHPSATVDSLIATFCVSKGVQYSPRFVLYTASHRRLRRTSAVAAANVNDGDVLYLGKKDNTSRRRTFHWWIMAALTCLLGSGGIIISSLLYAETGGHIPFDYGLIFDAGSSHTQVTVYQWAGEKDLGTGRAEQVASCTVASGISSYDISAVGQPLVDCVRNVSNKVPSGEMPKTPFYLGATAGMRLLHLSDSLLTEALLMAIRCALTTSGFSVKSVGIISGIEEGLFGWITVNYLQNILLDDHITSTSDFDGNAHLVTSLKTLGAMDLGGASTQVVYEVPAEAALEPGLTNCSLVTVRLYGHNYQLCSRSYLCYGIQEAYRRYLAQLVENSSSDETYILNPFGPKGGIVNYTADFLFNHPCTKSKHQSQHSSVDIENKTFTFIGDSDEEGCSRTVNQLFNISFCSDKFTECLQPITLPQESQFLAFSAFYYAMENMNLTNATLPEYKNATSTLCRKSLNDIDMRDTDDLHNKLCFNSQYVYYILIQGYNITESSWNNIAFIKKIDGNDLGWSLGYMINATNAIPAEKPTPALIDLPAFVVILLLSSLVLVMSILFFSYACQRHRNPGMYEHLIDA